MVVKHLVGAGRTQKIDERADEAQDRDFDQRNDEADGHQGGEIGPDLPAIPSIEANQARWRHAVVVIAKRIDAGLEETEHGLGFHSELQAEAGFGSEAGRDAENSETADETREKLRLGMRTKAEDASGSAQAALSGRGGPRVLHAFGGGARVGSRRSPDCVESKSFRLPQVRADTGSRGPDNPREPAADTLVASRSQLTNGCAAQILANVLHAGDSRGRDVRRKAPPSGGSQSCHCERSEAIQGTSGASRSPGSPRRFAPRDDDSGSRNWLQSKPAFAGMAGRAPLCFPA